MQSDCWAWSLWDCWIRGYLAQNLEVNLQWRAKNTCTASANCFTLGITLILRSRKAQHLSIWFLCNMKVSWSSWSLKMIRVCKEGDASIFHILRCLLFYWVSMDQHLWLQQHELGLIVMFMPTVHFGRWQKFFKTLLLFCYSANVGKTYIFSFVKRILRTLSYIHWVVFFGHGDADIKTDLYKLR